MKRPASTPHVQRSLPGTDDVLRRTLSNGITVLARPNFNSPSVSISGYVVAGNLLDTDERLGLADFAASMLMRGTERRTFDQVFGALEEVGASLGYDSGAHSTTFGGRSLSEDLPLLLEVLSETLRMPTFPADEVEKLRAQLLTGLAIRAQDTGDMASLTFDKILFDGHPYSRPGDGYPETVQAITRADLTDFHGRFIGPNGMVLALVGGVQPQEAIEQVERTLGNWAVSDQAAVPELPPYQALAATTRRNHAIAGKSQSDIILGTAGPRRKDPEFMATSLGNSILGQFGMMGRIGDVVREKSGLAYYAHSSLSAGLGPGSWEVSAGVNPANVEKTIDLILVELRRFVGDGVTAEELADSQSNFIGRLPLSLESNAGVAGALANIERFDLGLDYYRTYADLVRSVSVDDVLTAARQYIDPERLAIAVAGP